MSTSSNSIPVFNGEPDLSFADQGKFTLPVIPNTVFTSILGLGKDEKHLYLAGYIFYQPLKNDYVCCRLSLDGKLDTSFGDQGYARGNFPEEDGETNGVAEHVIVQDIDGEKKILLIGEHNNRYQRPALIRLNSDGSPDKSYGKDGTVIIKLPSPPLPAPDAPGSTANIPQAIALEDGKVIVLKMAIEGTYVIRVDKDGSLDKTFNGSGYRLFNAPNGGNTFLRTVLNTTDGKYLLGGSQFEPGKPASGLIIRLLTDGTEDPDYGVNGVVEIVDDSAQERGFGFNTLAPQNNNRTAAIGQASRSVRSGLITSREPDGSPNIQFNKATPLVTQLEFYPTAWSAGRMLPNGKLQVAGQADEPLGSNKNLVVVQLQPNGEFDNTFGINGVVRFAGDAGAMMMLNENRVFFSTHESQQVIQCGLVP
ncbi:hypothetical protein [Pseudomonas sp. RL_5y_Pfl2_70]|uniref:hypothetical protein n=1 Tax=Pseudomonas sp. RL_5y_Pfl2_70 TaxID=3088712 RepID=UPI0030D8EED7